ncbi:MAG TPA: gluconate:H+ symporter [Terriglobales bacterium]|jgi:GntP family gluconate:H+ symporter|nr:gluconate:H+ symporter [Terriglobales bacterium]
MINGHDAYLLLSALASVIALVFLIARLKLNPFIVLMAVSVALALVTRMPPANIVKSFEAGVGNTLGHIAIIVALGTMLGKMMAESGGAERIAITLIGLFGESRVPWAMAAVGFLVGLPVFFEVGFVLLVPIAYNVARRTGTPLVLVGLPMVAGLSVVHGLVPPHPAAMLAVTAYNADIGRTVLLALLVGIPTVIVAGPLYAKFIARYVHVDLHNPIADQFLESAANRELPSFTVTVATILLPIALMLVGSWADAFSAPQTWLNGALHLIGSADLALLIGAAVSFITLGRMRGFTRETILKFSEESLAPTATITLLIGAGGGFGRILQDSGTSQAIINFALHAHISIILSAWLVAALVRIATGSATVAMTMASGIIAPVAVHSGVRPELLTIATGAGSLVLSHFNDGGFWLVKEYFGMDVPQTLKSWTICETIISVFALLLTMGLSSFMSH